MLVLCTWISHAYSQSLESSDPKQEELESCFPPDEYISHPGDPPFGVYVQTTERHKSKNYLLGVLYCEDGTFEVSSSPQGTVSLSGTIFRTGRWWWEPNKSCTQLDPIGTETEIPPVNCKEAGHWLGDQKVQLPRNRLTAGVPATRNHKRHRSIAGQRDVHQ